MATFQDLLTTLANDQATIVGDQNDIAVKTQAVTDANSGLTAANLKLTADNATLTTDNAAVGVAVNARGPFYVLNQDNTVTVYESDGNGFYVMKTAQPATTDLGGGPTPPLTGS